MNEQAGLADRNLQEYYEAMLEMFGTKGWAFFMEDIEKLRLYASTIDDMQIGQTVDYRLGQRQVLDVIRSQPVVVRAAYDGALGVSDNE